jgi:hypothetical protein
MRTGTVSSNAAAPLRSQPKSGAIYAAPETGFQEPRYGSFPKGPRLYPCGRFSKRGQAARRDCVFYFGARSLPTRIGPSRARSAPLRRSETQPALYGA